MKRDAIEEAAERSVGATMSDIASSISPIVEPALESFADADETTLEVSHEPALESFVDAAKEFALLLAGPLDLVLLEPELRALLQDEK